MKTYFDTSYLVALYVPNDHTAAALRHRGREHELPVLFNPLHRLGELARRQFAHSSPTWLSGDDLTLNRLANPFTKAFTDRSWRELVRRLKLASPDGLAAYESHFFTCAKSEIVDCLRHNALFDEFRSRQGIVNANHAG